MQTPQIFMSSNTGNLHYIKTFFKQTTSGLMAKIVELEVWEVNNMVTILTLTVPDPELIWTSFLDCCHSNDSLAGVPQLSKKRK